MIKINIKCDKTMPYIGKKFNTIIDKNLLVGQIKYTLSDIIKLNYNFNINECELIDTNHELILDNNNQKIYEKYNNQELYFYIENKNIIDGITCRICLDSIIINNMSRLRCNHIFCRTCFIKWTTRSCPICRCLS
jgi:hypothetical protein